MIEPHINSEIEDRNKKQYFFLFLSIFIFLIANFFINSFFEFYFELIIIFTILSIVNNKFILKKWVNVNFEQLFNYFILIIPVWIIL